MLLHFCLHDTVVFSHKCKCLLVEYLIHDLDIYIYIDMLRCLFQLLLKVDFGSDDTSLFPAFYMLAGIFLDFPLHTATFV